MPPVLSYVPAMSPALTRLNPRPTQRPTDGQRPDSRSHSLNRTINCHVATWNGDIQVHAALHFNEGLVRCTYFGSLFRETLLSSKRGFAATETFVLFFPQRWNQSGVRPFQTPRKRSPTLIFRANIITFSIREICSVASPDLLPKGTSIWQNFFANPF